MKKRKEENLSQEVVLAGKRHRGVQSSFSRCFLQADRFSASDLSLLRSLQSAQRAPSLPLSSRSYTCCVEYSPSRPEIWGHCGLTTCLGWANLKPSRPLHASYSSQRILPRSLSSSRKAPTRAICRCTWRSAPNAECTLRDW